MKRNARTTIGALGCAALATVALAGCTSMLTGQHENGTRIGYAENSEGNVTAIESPELETEALISMDEARNIALKHAGLSEDDVTIVHEGRDTDYGNLALEVEFYDGTNEYDYSIDADTGDILQYDEDAEHYAISDMHLETPPSTDSSDYIGEDAAKAAALLDAGVKEDDTIGMRIALDFDNRVVRYEVEFATEEKEYEYEINAVSGDVMSFDTNRID